MPRTSRLVALAACVALPALTVVYVPEDSAAVRESHGGDVTPLSPGLHLRVPLYQRVFRYDSDTIRIDEPLTVVTRDKASFKLPITLSARVSRGDVVTFHQGRAGREPGTYIGERAREAVLAAAASLSADEVLAADAARRMAPAVSADLITRGIADDGLTLGRPAPQVVLNAVLDYLRRDLPASARVLAERALAQDPREAHFQAALGAVLEAEGKKKEAEERYLEALYADPTAIEPMSRLYVMYQSTSDGAAIRRLERLLVASLEKDGSSAIHHDWLGQVYMRLGQDDRAETSFRTAIGLAPKEPEFHISLGALKAKGGKLEEARAEYARALELRPEHPLASYNMGVAYALEGRTDQAIEMFHKAERAGSTGHVLLNALAQAYEIKGEDARAADYLRRSLAANPKQPERRAALTRIEARLRRSR